MAEKIRGLARQYLALLGEMIAIRHEISHTTAYPPDTDPAN
ncbi:MAG TPA: hypothetical protein VKR29_12685 [Candidatus Binataceae bacterium]|nr:hypothetical protein [Candidatus Binataceae bacterium]